MDFNSAKANVVRKAARQLLLAKKNSPTLMFAAGVVGFAATVVMASKATLKLEEVVLEPTQSQLEMSNKLHDADSDLTTYTETDYKKDLVLIHAKAAGRLAKLYGPSIIVGSLSIGCLAGAQIVLNRRNAALTAAYVTVEKAFQKYRAQVIQEFGPEKDAEIRRSSLETPPWREDEVEKTPIKLEQARGEYMFLFDETNKNWKSQPGYNAMFLRSQQNWANELLRARGHVFLNEVLEWLGFDHTKAGSVVGWIANADTVGDGDGYISFGVFEGDVFAGKMFVNGDENSVWLEFNVDGLIYDKI